MGELLKVNNLTKTFPGVKALDNLSFSLKQGEVHALCGENGAGKSTLIKCISGIWKYGSYEGEITLGESLCKFTGIQDSEKAGIAVIYQELALVEDMTVAENIFLGREPRKGLLVDWHKMYKNAHDLLHEFGLNLNPASKVGSLGVGQQQLVEIVKALAKNARVLLLDEPTAALTDKEVEILLNIVEKLRVKGICCVYISHRLEEVLKIADTITVIRDGQSIASKPRIDWTYNSIVSAMVGREITDLYPRASHSKGEMKLDVKDFKSGILKDISFKVYGGEVLGLGGLMGAGRSELLMDIFAGIGSREEGDITLNGKPYISSTALESISRGLIMVTEDRKKLGLILDESIAFNLSLSNLSSFQKNGLINGHAEMAENKKYASSLRVKAPDLSVTVGGLSGGNQQKVVLGRALMTEPEIIFLDEPTRGIDVGAKVEVYELINKLTSQGKAVVLVSSEMPELIGMSDRILILSNGRIAGEFSGDDVNQKQLLEAAMKYS